MPAVGWHCPDQPLLLGELAAIGCSRCPPPSAQQQGHQRQSAATAAQPALPCATEAAASTPALRLDFAGGTVIGVAPGCTAAALAVPLPPRHTAALCMGSCLQLWPCPRRAQRSPPTAMPTHAAPAGAAAPLAAQLPGRRPVPGSTDPQPPRAVRCVCLPRSRLAAEQLGGAAHRAPAGPATMRGPTRGAWRPRPGLNTRRTACFQNACGRRRGGFAGADRQWQPARRSQTQPVS